jgi:hypothetical protein
MDLGVERPRKYKNACSIHGVRRTLGRDKERPEFPYMGAFERQRRRVMDCKFNSGRAFEKICALQLFLDDYCECENLQEEFKPCHDCSVRDDLDEIKSLLVCRGNDGHRKDDA